MMDNTDPEVQFNPGNGDCRERSESPRRNYRGQSADRNHDGHDKSYRNNRCCYGTPRPSIVLKPDPYNGDEDWEHFEDCVELGQWTDKEMLLTLAASLKGQARVFYTSLPGPEKISYGRLTAALEQRFGSTRQQARWLSKFQARNKLYGESIATFGDDLRLLARKAYGNLEPEAQEILALQQFYKALSVEMRCRIMDRDCKTISEAVEVVERYEELLGDVPHTTKRRDMVRQVGSENDAYHDDIQKTLNSIQSRLDKLEKGQDQNQQKGKRACFICQSPDHFYRNCPHKQTKKAANNKFQAKEDSENGQTSTL
jgi:hypothetical protein